MVEKLAKPNEFSYILRQSLALFGYNFDMFLPVFKYAKLLSALGTDISTKEVCLHIKLVHLIIEKGTQPKTIVRSLARIKPKEKKKTNK